MFRWGSLLLFLLIVTSFYTPLFRWLNLETPPPKMALKSPEPPDVLYFKPEVYTFDNELEKEGSPPAMADPIAKPNVPMQPITTPSPPPPSPKPIEREELTTRINRSLIDETDLMKAVAEHQPKNVFDHVKEVSSLIKDTVTTVTALITIWGWFKHTKKKRRTARAA